MFDLINALFALYAEGFGTGCPMCIFVALWVTLTPLFLVWVIVDMVVTSRRDRRERKARAVDAHQRAVLFESLMVKAREEKAAAVAAYEAREARYHSSNAVGR